MSRGQVIAIALVILITCLVTGWRSELQDDKIRANANRISATQQESCLAGREIVRGFNELMDDLARIERDQDSRPDLAKRRIEAYERGVVAPIPVCSR